MKAVQKFSDEYLDNCRSMSPDQIAVFLDDFRRLQHARPARTRLISLKVPEDLLATFRQKAALSNTRYQTQIKRLMAQWVSGETD